jgi:serine/threonine protein kinase
VEAALVALHEVSVLHRDIKPSNILLSCGDNPTERIAVLNDYGKSCKADEIVKGGGVPLLWTSPDADMEGLSTRDDDYFSLGLTFAHLHGLQVDDPYSAQGKLRPIEKLCDLDEVYAKCLKRFKVID